MDERARRVQELRRERERLMHEAGRLTYPWQARRRRQLRRRAAELRREIVARLERLSPDERAEDALSLFCADLRSDGRLDELEVRREQAPGDPHRFLISHRGCEPSAVSLPPRPAEELRRPGRLRETATGAFRDPGPREVVVDGEATDWHTAVEWVRADLLAASYGPGNPHPAYLRELEERERERSTGSPPARPPRDPVRALLLAPVRLADGLAFIYWGSGAAPLATAVTLIGGGVLCSAGKVFLGVALLALPALALVAFALMWLAEQALVRPWRRRRGLPVHWPADRDGYLRVRDAEGRLHVLSALDRRLVREGVLQPDGRRRRHELADDIFVRQACWDEPPADLHLGSPEAALDCLGALEGHDSPRSRAELKRLLQRVEARRQGAAAG